jgi:beta-1,4-mannosyl-glycoprotein beta-1,4-N-acetylglucosaminyltransferase
MKIFDAFTFFNETELLKIRLELLKDVVDYHVIAESNLTHSGKEKEYILESEWNSYSEYHSKMIYLPVVQSTEGLSFEKVDTYSPTNGSWQLENQQRNALHYIKDKVKDDDYVLIGDLDELPSPEAITVLRSMPPPPFPLSMQMLFHYYYMNCQNVGYDRLWNGTVVCTGKQFKEQPPQYYRDNRNAYHRFPKGGYHFSFLGGPEKIKQKIEAFAHTEFNRDDIKEDTNIISAYSKGIDVLNRPGVEFEFVNPYQYPKEIRDLMHKYPHLIKWKGE